MESTDCGYLCPHEKGTQNILVCDEILNMKSDSFKVDMEPFSHLTNNDLTFNSRFSLQRSLSRKGSQIGEEKKMINPSVDDERDIISSPKVVGTMLEKLTPAIVTATEPQIHHQISIISGGSPITTNTTGTPTKIKLGGKRYSSFKQSSSIINPRRILFFFATLSSMGTMLLIYFTLSMAKRSGDVDLID